MAFPDPDVDYRAHPDKYEVGRGERGVLTCEPYKSEMLPLWRFATPELATVSANAILGKFREYRDAGEGPGMDLARKFLQMGFTRARRYANHPGGRKYGPDGAELPRGKEDPVKAECAEIFRAQLEVAKADPAYLAWRATMRG